MISANINNSVRRAVYRRDGYRCALCDDPRHLQIHHVVKRSLGGSSDPQNLITLCSNCHAMAHGTILGDWAETPEDIELAIVEYLADLYAEEGQVWNPYRKGKEEGP